VAGEVTLAPLGVQRLRRWDAQTIWRVGPPVAAATLTAIMLWLRLRGVDWPAQLYRVHLFRANGWLGFDTGWYGGNTPVAYSTLFPPVAATIGVRIVVLASVAVAAVCFDRIVRGTVGPSGRIGSMCFAVGLIVPVVIGQLPFLLGLASGLGSLLALTKGNRTVACTLALVCALSSFVAALFLVIAASALCLTATRSERVAPALVTATAVAPVAVVMLAYHQTGVFHFQLRSSPRSRSSAPARSSSFPPSTAPSGSASCSTRRRQWRSSWCEVRSAPT
jgi:hypothetical protein